MHKICMMQEKLWCRLHKKERSDFLFLRLRVYSKRLPLRKIHLSLKWEESRKDFALSDFILNSYAEGAQRCSNAAPLWVPARGGVRFTPYSTGVAHLNRTLARQSISLSSGIRMFARESETRGVRTNRSFLYRAWSRIHNQSELD